MENLKEQKKKLLQKFESASWPRELKTWQLDELLARLESKKISLNEFKAGFSKVPKGVSFYSYHRAPLELQAKLLKYYQAEGKLDRYLLSKLKNCFIVDIKTTSDIVVNWDNILSSSQFVLFIVSGQGKVEIIEEQKSRVNFLGQAVVVEIMPDSEVIYSLLMAKNKGFTNLYYRAYVSESSNFKWQTAVNNKAIINASLETVSQGKASQSYQVMAGKFLKSSKTNLWIINNHQGKNNEGDMVFKGLGDNQAKVHMEGVIRIGKEAKYSNSYLQEDIILLDKRASVKAIPNLEILNNEVKASHGATVGKIDDRAMFYLMSRGLDETLAKNLILAGFFKSIIGKIDNKIVRDKFSKVLI